jgi:hypothetical protein
MPSTDPVQESLTASHLMSVNSKNIDFAFHIQKGKSWPAKATQPLKVKK